MFAETYLLPNGLTALEQSQIDQRLREFNYLLHNSTILEYDANQSDVFLIILSPSLPPSAPPLPPLEPGMALQPVLQISVVVEGEVSVDWGAVFETATKLALAAQTGVPTAGIVVSASAYDTDSILLQVNVTFPQGTMGFATYQRDLLRVLSLGNLRNVMGLTDHPVQLVNHIELLGTIEARSPDAPPPSPSAPAVVAGRRLQVSGGIVAQNEQASCGVQNAQIVTIIATWVVPYEEHGARSHSHSHIPFRCFYFHTMHVCVNRYRLRRAALSQRLDRRAAHPVDSARGRRPGRLRVGGDAHLARADPRAEPTAARATASQSPRRDSATPRAALLPHDERCDAWGVRDELLILLLLLLPVRGRTARRRAA